MSTTNPRSIPTRGFLAAAVCLTTLAVAIAPAHAQTVTPPAPPCNQISGISGSIVTCSGDLSGGVNLPNAAGPFEVLNVINLTTDIAPASGTAGILFTSDGAVELNVDTAPFAIVTTNAAGIFAASGAGGTVTIRSAADIITAGNNAVGIQAGAQDELLTITSLGNIATSGDNTSAIVAGNITGAVNVTSVGNIATSGASSDGINVATVGTALTDDGAITITSLGDIATEGSVRSASMQPVSMDQ